MPNPGQVPGNSLYIQNILKFPLLFNRDKVSSFFEGTKNNGTTIYFCAAQLSQWDKFAKLIVRKDKKKIMKKENVSRFIRE